MQAQGQTFPNWNERKRQEPARRRSYGGIALRLTHEFNRQPEKIEIAASRSKHKLAPGFNRQLLPCFTFALRNGRRTPTLATVPGPRKTVLPPRLSLATNHSPLATAFSNRNIPKLEFSLTPSNINHLNFSNRNTLAIMRSVGASRPSAYHFLPAPAPCPKIQWNPLRAVLSPSLEEPRP